MLWVNSPQCQAIETSFFEVKWAKTHRKTPPEAQTQLAEERRALPPRGSMRFFAGRRGGGGPFRSWESAPFRRLNLSLYNGRRQAVRATQPKVSPRENP